MRSFTSPDLPGTSQGEELCFADHRCSLCYMSTTHSRILCTHRMDDCGIGSTSFSSTSSTSKNRILSLCSILRALKEPLLQL